MASHTDSSVFLYDVPPSLMEMVCKIIDGGDGSLGWRDLAARILPNWSELRQTERLEAAGKSPTGELLWSWAQKNKTVGDLLRVLKDMGHERALDVLRTGGFKPVPTEWSSHCADVFQKRSDGESAHEQLRYSPCAASQGCPLKDTITYRDVKEGTHNFHQNSRIWESTFSEVYKGTKGDQTFSVKLFKQEKNASWKKLWNAFRTEMEVLHHKQHPNILELWGCFLEGDRYCLVTPFLPRGSLFHQLHEQQGGVSLSWQDRLNIIKGTARGVAYLHTAPPCGVICANLTSQNILLDEQLQPKLSDFGQARLRHPPVTQSCTITLDTGPRGTLGYLPEEYIRDGKLSTALDVYSLGVVMMETLTGLKPELENPKHVQLREMLCSEVEGSGGTDVCLSHLDVGAGSWPHAIALRLFGLALDCAASRAKTRPGMHRVLEVLSQLLPLPVPPPDNLPQPLEDWPAVLGPQQGPRAPHSLPEEHNEPQSPAPYPAPQPEPCECSQSEVTFLSDVSRGAEQNWPCDLYSSWPVQCSCTAEDGQECEDCISNGFSAAQAPAPTDQSAHRSLKQHDHVRNSAKERFLDKIQLYNKGLIDTEELLSMKAD
nr:interleukin-1 receptor-associated kinase 3 [Anguilla japonica]